MPSYSEGLGFCACFLFCFAGGLTYHLSRMVAKLVCWWILLLSLLVILVIMTSHRDGENKTNNDLLDEDKISDECNAKSALISVNGITRHQNNGDNHPIIIRNSDPRKCF
jgi:hypothetical protein